VVASSASIFRVTGLQLDRFLEGGQAPLSIALLPHLQGLVDHFTSHVVGDVVRRMLRSHRRTGRHRRRGSKEPEGGRALPEEPVVPETQRFPFQARLLEVGGTASVAGNGWTKLVHDPFSAARSRPSKRMRIAEQQSTIVPTASKPSPGWPSRRWNPRVPER